MNKLLTLNVSRKIIVTLLKTHQPNNFVILLNLMRLKEFNFLNCKCYSTYKSNKLSAFMFCLFLALLGKIQ